MLKTLITALRLIWISATTRETKLRLIFSYIFGVIFGLITFFTPLALSEMIKQISQHNIEKTLFYFYSMVALAVALIVSRYIWRFSCEQISRILPINLRQIYYKKIFNKPYDWHLQNSVGYFATALTNVCKALEDWLWEIPFHYIGIFIVTFCFLIYTWLLSFYLFLYFAVSLVLMFLIIRFLYSRRIKYIEKYYYKHCLSWRHSCSC